MSKAVKRIDPAPGGYSPKNKPDILKMAEATTQLPESAKIPFSGAIRQEGPNFGPHSRAFASAATALAVLMGAPHDTSLMNAHNTTWRNDNDYYRHLMVSGEGFLFWHDVLDFFTDELPQGSEPADTWEEGYLGEKDASPILDCLAISGIKAELYSNYPAKGVTAGWDSPQALADLVLCNIAGGFPVLLFSGEPGDRILLATGYECSGETLLAWTFTAGDRDKKNTGFSPAKCKRVTDWTEHIIAAALVRTPFLPPEDVRPLLLKALARGADMLRLDSNPDRFRATFCGADKPHVYPEIWDLAERRCYLAAALTRAAEQLETDKLTAAIEAGREIHDTMWSVYAIWKQKKTKAARRQIADLLSQCRQLDFVIADTITALLADFRKEGHENE